MYQALRSLGRPPRMFACAVVCLAGAIGTATAVFASALSALGLGMLIAWQIRLRTPEIGVRLFTSYFTARAAARIDPLVALRNE